MTKLQEQVLELVKENKSISEIAKELNRNNSSISSVLKRFKVVNYKKMNENKCNHNYFDKIDNEEKSYLLGFFIADGYLMLKSNRFGIEIQENDKNILECARKNIYPESKIYTKNRTTNNTIRVNQCSFKWTSNHMKKMFMEKYKIIPNKTYDNNFEFPFETIPENLISHFIRGFIDGDGSFDKKENRFRLTIIGTSEKFLKQLGIYISKITEGIEYKIRKNTGKTVNYYTLTFNLFRTDMGNKALKIYNYLYNDSNICVKRKKDTIESYLKYRGKL